ncbi:MAG: hypothetical protein AB1555_18520 [Nitrospirota bacterium]
MDSFNDPARWLRMSLRSNAAFSGMSGLVLLIAAGPIAAFLGVEAPWIIRGLGPGLLVFAVWLSVVASRPSPDRREVWSAIGLDGAWVIGSAALLLWDLWPLTAPGKWAVGITADLVATFAVLQMVGLFKYEAAHAMFPPVETSRRYR